MVSTSNNQSFALNANFAVSAAGADHGLWGSFVCVVKKVVIAPMAKGILAQSGETLVVSFVQATSV